MTKYRAIIIGATSGIGHEVAHSLAQRGVILGIAGRRTERLDALMEEYGAERIYCAKMDVREDSATEALDELISKVGAPDLLLYASGIGKQNPKLDEEIECQTVLTNSLGMVRIVDHFLNYVKREERYSAKHKAHIAVITSVAGTRGMGSAPAYSATKSMQSSYIEALAQHARMEHIPAIFSDIRPGFVATEILNPEKHYPMLISVDKAARHILRGLKHRRRIITFDWRFRLITHLWRLIPRCLWERMTFIRN
ncbi:MAG: SDR family NAD(P)-dependent oxidoreductase [Alistipes sp.]|nr:SDR family NAD(P)-dependent oxidoreductase [Alistipes sp.]